LEATLTLFAERGIDSTSMDAIADASGVSKATIYKHWPDKDALTLEALALLFGLYEEPPKFDSGDLREDLVAALTYQPAHLRQTMKDRIMPHVMAYAARNREFGEKWRSRMVELPQTRLKKLLKRGRAKKELNADIDLNIGLALLFGPMLYQHIFVSRKIQTPETRRMAAQLATQVVNAFLRAYGQGKNKAGRR
jgi:AcrR family transcriptional regulator